MSYEASKETICRTCGGSGEVQSECTGYFAAAPTGGFKTCDACHGSGYFLTRVYRATPDPRAVKAVMDIEERANIGKLAGKFLSKQ